MACIDPFTDPLNTKQLMNTIKTLPTLGDIKPLLDKVFPEWIIGSMEKYSNDYPHLQKNWEIVCKKTGTTPMGIIIVKEMYFDDSHKLLQLFAETMTRAGFVVRRKGELMPCDNCNLAIPHPNLYDKMKIANLPVPKRWSRTCTICN